MSYRLIPSRAHGIIDYCAALLLILTPLGAGFSSAQPLPVALGIILFIYSLFTSYELSLFKFMSVSSHLGIDALISVVLIASPFVLGYSTNSWTTWLPQIIVGLILGLTAIFTKTAPAGTPTPIV